MSEWHESKRKPNSNFRKLLLERIEQANPRRTLNIEEQRRLSKLEVIADKLRRGENVQNRQLQTWLDEFDNASERTSPTNTGSNPKRLFLKGGGIEQQRRRYEQFYRCHWELGRSV